MSYPTHADQLAEFTRVYAEKRSVKRAAREMKIGNDRAGQLYRAAKSAGLIASNPHRSGAQGDIEQAIADRQGVAPTEDAGYDAPTMADFYDLGDDTEEPQASVLDDDPLPGADDEPDDGREKAEAAVGSDRRDAKIARLERETEALRELLSDQGKYLTDQDVAAENVRLSRALQGARDRLRMERKTHRESGRVQSAWTEVSEELLSSLDAHGIRSLAQPSRADAPGDAVGVIQISDLHLNECVVLPHNSYDWQIAAQRIRKHVIESKRFFDSHGVSHVLVALTADMLNSDRRYDEMLNNSTNRAKALHLAVELLSQVLEDLRADYHLTVASVCGNESRIDEDTGPSQIVASNNFDYTIFNSLAMLWRDSDVEFLLDDDPTEVVVNLNGQNWLLLHGHTMRQNANMEKVMMEVTSKYARRGTTIDYCIFGHIHAAYVADTFARSGSPVGDNEYSSKQLQLSGRASQNCYVVDASGNRHGLKVDLQHADDIEPYDINRALESYNTKDHRQRGTVVIQSVTT